jgi:hypothetical protein
MTTRRQFLGKAVAMSALSLAGGSAVAGIAHGGGPLRVSLVVFDRDVKAGRAFAARAAAQGSRTHGTSADMTALWYSDLDRRWRTTRDVVAGFTGESALLWLEQLGRRSDRRVLFRVEHRPTADGQVEHRLYGRPAIVAQVRQVIQRPSWAAGMAAIIGNYPRRERRPGASHRWQGPAGMTGDWAEPMVSWLMVPRSVVPIQS